MSEPIITKRCPKCKQTKPILDFHKCYSRKDGHSGHCKLCEKLYHQTEKCKEYQKAYQKEYAKTEKRKKAQRKYRQTPKAKAYQKRYSQTDAGKKFHSIAVKRHEAANPERKVAYTAVANLIARNLLQKASKFECGICNKPASQYHHLNGYEPESWFDIMPVCNSCHCLLHVLG